MFLATMTNNTKDPRRSKPNAISISPLCPYQYLTYSCRLTPINQNEPIYFYCVTRHICRGTGTSHPYTRLIYFSLRLFFFLELCKDEGTLSLPEEFEQWTEITTTYQCPFFCHTKPPILTTSLAGYSALAHISFTVFPSSLIHSDNVKIGDIPKVSP